MGILKVIAFLVLLPAAIGAPVFESGFEGGSIDFPDNWSLRDNGMSMVTGERVRTGRRALRIVDSDSGKLGSSALSERFPIKPGERAEASLWCWLESGDRQGLGVYLEFIDRAGRFTEERKGFRQPLILGKWNLIVVDRLAPPGSSAARIWLHTISDSVMTCVIDDVAATIDSEPPPVSVSNWLGTTLDPDHRKNWTAGLRWDHGATTKVDKKFDRPQDWSGHSRLSLNLFSKKNTGSSFVMIFSSENEETEGGDYYSLKLPVNFTGWKSFHLPLSDLRVSRKPKGFHHIQDIKLRADGYSLVVDQTTVIILDGLRVE